jgi:hypothetical protein
MYIWVGEPCYIYLSELKERYVTIVLGSVANSWNFKYLDIIIIIIAKWLKQSWNYMITYNSKIINKWLFKHYIF